MSQTLESELLAQDILRDCSDPQKILGYLDALEEETGQQFLYENNNSSRINYGWYAQPNNSKPLIEQLEAQLINILGSVENSNDKRRWSLAVDSRTGQPELYFYEGELPEEQRAALPCGLCIIDGQEAIAASALINQERLGENLQHVNAKNNDGDTALIVAARRGQIERVKTLLAYPGIDPNAANDRGASALMETAYNGDSNIVRTLVALPSIDINRQNILKENALMWAAAKGRTGTVNELLAHEGINVNSISSNGNTALMWAAKSEERYSAGTVEVLANDPRVNLSLHDQGEKALKLSNDENKAHHISEAMVKKPRPSASMVPAKPEDLQKDTKGATLE